MLKRGLLVALTGLVLGAAEPPDESAVRVPVRLTAGASNQLMGVLAPDEQALYFVSNSNATLEPFVQAPLRSGPKRLFESHGDIAWPKVSPDGRHLAYISFVRDATGDACVRALPDGDERCLTKIDSAELQVDWLADSRRVAILTRRGLHAGFSLELRAIDGSAGKAPVLATRNMVGMALSPDRRYVAYIPIEGTRPGVGVTFANRTGQGVELLRVDAEAPQPVVWTPRLPGVTGYLAFSPDGEQLYFSQYLNDTNRDGVIDGNDHSVIFRVPFVAEAEHPIAGAEPEQLTSARWNCHYPAPAASQLVMTCSHEGSLDIYALPLDGAVPSAWDAERVRAEVGASRDLWSRLLLLARLLPEAESSDSRLRILRRIVGHHLELREYESAIYYAEQIVSEAAPGSDFGRQASLLAHLAKHRRADVQLTRGELSREYVSGESLRIQAVMLAGREGSADLRALAQLVESEIRSDVGDKTGALRVFDAIEVDALSEPLVIELLAQRGRWLLSLLGARDRLHDLLRQLSEHPALGAAQRLRLAGDFLQTLIRGARRDQRAERVLEWRAKAPEGSELAFMLDIEAALLRLGEEDQDTVRKRLFDLYKAHKDPGRRRALALMTVQHAARSGNEYLQYQFATTWASGVKRADPERKYAEALYGTVVLERAYGELSDAEISEARGYFFRTSRNTRSLEAHMGFIEARILEGKTDTAAFYQRQFARDPKAPAYLFVQAYLLARELPLQPADASLDSRVDEIAGLLEDVSQRWPRKREVHQLWGYALLQRALRRGDREDAVAANRQYLLALDLSREDPRARAAILQALGTVQAALGNHRRALQHLELRERLPFVRAEARLAAHVASAHSLFHVRRREAALSEARAALALLDQDAALARFRPLVLSRLALYELDAGTHGEAAAHYAALGQLLDAQPALGTPINRLKVKVGLASAQLAGGHFDQALATTRACDALLEANDALRAGGSKAWRRSLVHAYDYVWEQYRILVVGLRAQALLGLKQLESAGAALEERRALLEDRYAKTEADEDLLDIARAEYQLGLLAQRRGDTGEAVEQFESALERVDLFRENTGTELHAVGLRVLRAYVELAISAGLSPGALGRDLGSELERTYAFITTYRNPEWAEARFALGLYLTLLRVSAEQWLPTTDAIVSSSPR